jgi:hypothetical protein
VVLCVFRLESDDDEEVVVDVYEENASNERDEPSGEIGASARD